MLILGIDSATPVASAALADENGLLGEVLLNVGLTHSEQLLPMIDDLLRQCRRRISEVTVIGVSAGPGSFTGLRIGMATAKALAQGLSAASGVASAAEAVSGGGVAVAASGGAAPGTSDAFSDAAAAPGGVAPGTSVTSGGSAPGEGVRLLAIPTLEAMAWQLAGQPAYVSPMLNARRGQIYTALYQWTEGSSGSNSSNNGGNGSSGSSSSGSNSSGSNGSGDLSAVFASRQRGKKDRLPAGADLSPWAPVCLIPPEAAGPEAWAERLARQKSSVYLLGDGAAMYREIWARSLGERAVILPPFLGLCRGSFIALAALGKLARSGEEPAEDFYPLKPIYLRGI
ncbi:MAG: tRNA (adenosine(37)-N6)-threonylcarbamoyltransferase complex dimerization subunit type 1 TsaB [Clostridiales bacterium]|nr:tRNA (adenosine(37)-N6)-threonylcarbamoyltransferase complex dimerization subunit type 1 TsaB [Clostridiales bacterium]